MQKICHGVGEEGEASHGVEVAHTPDVVLNKHIQTNRFADAALLVGFLHANKPCGVPQNGNGKRGKDLLFKRPLVPPLVRAAQRELVVVGCAVALRHLGVSIQFERLRNLCRRNHHRGCGCAACFVRCDGSVRAGGHAVGVDAIPIQRHIPRTSIDIRSDDSAFRVVAFRHHCTQLQVEGSRLRDQKAFFLAAEVRVQDFHSVFTRRQRIGIVPSPVHCVRAHTAAVSHFCSAVVASVAAHW